jgi:hypothetical protein
MSDRYDEYRRQAEFCEKMSRRSNTMESKVSWLRLASKWLALVVPEGDASEAESFAVAVQRKGTRQEDLQSAH